MLYFYRRFPPQAPSLPPLDDISGPNIKGSHPVTMTDALVALFNVCKTSCSPGSSRSNRSIYPRQAGFNYGRGRRPPIAGARRLVAPCLLLEAEPGTAKIQCLRHELLAIYEAMGYFRHTLEALHFTILTDQKTTHLRHPTEKGQLLTTPVKPPRFHLGVHGHPQYIRPGQHRHRRAFMS